MGRIADDYRELWEGERPDEDDVLLDIEILEATEKRLTAKVERLRSCLTDVAEWLARNNLATTGHGRLITEVLAETGGAQ